MEAGKQDEILRGLDNLRMSLSQISEKLLPVQIVDILQKPELLVSLSFYTGSSRICLKAYSSSFVHSYTLHYSFFGSQVVT